MPGKNRVAPTDNDINSMDPSEYESNEYIDNEILHKYFLKYVSGKSCYHQHAVQEAQINKQVKKFAFEIEIWTVIEKRTTDWEEKPNDNLDAPGDAVGDVFEKYHYNSPDTTLEKTQRGGELLMNTRIREICPGCNGDGKVKCFICGGKGITLGKTCPSCKGNGTKECNRCERQGKVIRTARLNIEWRKIHSDCYHHNTFLPDDCIKNAKSKQCLVDSEEFCRDQSLDATFPHLRGEIQKNCPVNFSPFLKKQFDAKHLKEVNATTIIRKIKCRIQMIEILEVHYQSDTYINPRSQDGKL